MNLPINTPPGNASEDAFFVLRDCRTLFQRRLVEIVRLAGVVTPSVSEAFVEALGAGHDELAASNQRDGFEQTHGLTSSRITLLGDDDLELEIRIGDIARRLIETGGRDLWNTHLRYMTLLRRPEMAPEDNPLGPETICQGLWAICRASGAGLEGNFTLLDRIEEQFSLQLAGLYGELSALLASRNIEPAQTRIATPGAARSTGTSQPAPGAEGKADPLSALQSMLSQQFGGAENGGIAFPSAPGGAAGGNMALNAATMVMLNQLAARLDQLESSGLMQNLPGEIPGNDNPLRPQTVRAKDLDLPLGRPEAIALDTLALIFEAIFDTWELPDTIKTTIGRLQIPLLKLAIFDPSLFSDTSHPARRLINGMARASIGLPRNVGRAHPISAALWQLAGTVSETLQGDASVLTAPLAQLDALIAERDRDIQAAAQAYIPLLRNREARDHASQAAERWLQAFKEQDVAPEILDFLCKYWVRVMEAASVEANGAEDQADNAWQQNDSVIVDLLWSVQPKQSVDDRKRLSMLVPKLLKQISAGLDRIGTPAEERTAFLDTCFKLQTAALRCITAPPAPPVRTTTGTQTAMSAVPPPAGIVVELLEADGKQLKFLTLPGQTASAYRNPATGAETGSWLQFAIKDSEPLCGLICWQNEKSGSVLIYNPDWGFAVAASAAVLAQQLRDSQARIVSALAIFDLAAERAISRMAGA
jgi:hypothetical protein